VGAAAPAGCMPGPQSYNTGTHWDGTVEPGASVEVPREHTLQAALVEAPIAAEYVPRAQGVGAAAPSPAHEPGGATAHAAEPSGAYLPAAHKAHTASSVALSSPLARPAGQSWHAASVCPGAGL
jgi:hypothetical protein